jgi:mannosyltransferase OCH1-like enzyme
MARSLSPTELMDRPLAPALHAIPRLIHQSWSSSVLPKKFATWSDRCRELHPEWEWVLWTDDDNERLFERFFPWLVDAFTSLPGPIYRADLSRNAYMLLFGGYVQFDIARGNSLATY